MKKFAFVVGIGEHQSPELGRISGAVKDADRVRSLLAGDDQEAPIVDPWEIRPVVVNSVRELSVGSSTALSAAFDGWLRDVKCSMDTETHVLMYFAGHALLTDPDSDGVKQVALQALDSQWTTGSYLTKQLLELDAHNTTVILDCCHAGGVVDEVRRVEARRGEEGREEFAGLSVLAACKTTQKALNYNERGGEFTSLALKGLGRDFKVGVGPVTADRLVQYVKNHWGGLSKDVIDAQQPVCISNLRDHPVPLVTLLPRQSPDSTHPSDTTTSPTSNAPVLGPRNDIQVEQSGVQLRLSWVSQVTATATAWTAPVMINAGDRALAVTSVYDRSGAFILVTGPHGTRVVRAQTDGTSTSRLIPGVEECASAHFGVGAELGTVILTSRDGSTHRCDLVGGVA